MKTLIENSKMPTKPINVNGKSTNGHISHSLNDDILKALHSLDGFGSIEIYVQNFSVTQITVRNIKKTKHILTK